MFVMYREPSIIKKSKDGRVAAVDMASELLNSRVLLLEGEVNDVTCNGLIKSMLVLEHQSAAEPITLIINSPGGSVTAGLALIDTMQSLDCPVITVGEGVVASMAAVILACGDRRPGVPPHAGAHSPANGRHRHGAADRYRDCGPAYGSHACRAGRATGRARQPERSGVPRAHRARLLVQCQARPRAGPGGRGNCAQQEGALAETCLNRKSFRGLGSSLRVSIRALRVVHLSIEPI